MFAGALDGQPYQPDERTLLLDHLDEDFVPDGQRCTKPAVITADGDFSGGRPTEGGQFTEGKFGKAFQFHGLMQMSYPAGGNLDLSAGSVEFWVALNFNAAEVKKDPGVLSNQLFFTVWGPGSSMVCLYSTLGHTCVGVWDRERQLVCYGHFEAEWKKGEWHHLELKWGRQLELWCDGERRVTQDWYGLFGPLDVQPEDLRISLGSHLGWSTVESEFMIDEIRLLGPGGEQVPDYPLLTIPRLPPPTVDGEIGEGEWAGAARLTGFVGLNDPALVEDQTVVYVGWDEEALYVACECLDPQKRPLRAALKDRDSNVWLEDAVDIFLQPEADPATYYQFIASANGTVYDSRITMVGGSPQPDLSFNPQWTVQTSQSPGCWVLEARIPFRELDGHPAPQDGDRWRVNFCRDADAGSRLSSWAYMAGNFHRPAAFGEAIFRAGDRAIRIGPLGEWATGKVEAQVGLTGLAFDPLVTVRGRVVGADAKTILETENRLADYKAVAIKAPPLVTGLYHLTVRAETSQGPLFYQRLPFRVRKLYDIVAEGYPYEGKLWITSHVAGLPEVPEGLVARSWLRQGEKVVGTGETTEFVQGRGAAWIDLTDLPPGKYVVQSEAVAPDGKVLASAEAEFEQFPRPTWWRSQAGIDHSVPWPWEPVRMAEGTLHVWGREYRCGRGSLPDQVMNQGEEMLAAPITFKLSAEGQTLDLADLAPVQTFGGDDAVVRAAEATLGSLQAQLRTTTEFDGLMRCDLTLTPTAPTEVSNLTLEIPLKRPYATFLLPSNGCSASASVLGPEAWRSAFLPQVWVGNDDLGFAWFAESDQYWQPRDGEMLEVAPEGAKTVLRCRMVRQPWRLEQPVTFTFGLLATPVKDAHAGDPFWFRFGDEVGGQVPLEFCRYPGRGNLDPQQGTLEFWLAPAFDAGGAGREVVRLTGPGGSLSLTFTHASEQGMNLTATQGNRQETLAARGMQLRPNEYTHVAITWSDQVELFVGGKRYGAVGLNPLTVRPERAVPPAASDGAADQEWGLRLGCFDEWRGYTRIALDEVRISSVVRYRGEEVEVPTAAFQKDAATLLLDHLDEPFRPDGEDAETRAEVISGRSGELGGIPSLGCRFVEGKFGSGLQIANHDPLTPAEAAQHYGFNASLFWWLIEENATTTGWPPPLMREPLIPNLRQRVRAHHELGLRAAPYMGYPALGAPSPLSAQFGPEWSRRPLSTQPYEPPKGHYFWDVCGRSGFADYMAAGTQWVLEELGFYGCYTDGLATVYPCQNTHHGCGYVDEQGTLRSTWPLFATREMLKRMYKLIHARHQDGYLVNHVSFNTLIPTLSFTDVYYTGEHEQYEDLVKCRVRWQGKQWGFWTTLLGPDSHSYEPLHTTYGLLHGVSVWPQGFLGRNDMSRKTVNLWQTYDRFGYREAEWIPYYRAEPDLVKADDEQVKVSLYLRRGKRALLVVGNLAHEVINCRVHVNLEAMGLTNPSAKNALDGRSLPLQGQELSVRLRPVSFVLAWVE